MEESRQATVLFADVSSRPKLYETAGDAAALTAIGRCIERMRKAAESTGGRVVKTIGDEIMALFPSPDAAAGAASEMHATRSEEHTSELQSLAYLVCRLLLEKKKKRRLIERLVVDVTRDVVE